jgi:hypothetical protein
MFFLHVPCQTSDMSQSAASMEWRGRILEKFTKFRRNYYRQLALACDLRSAPYSQRHGMHVAATVSKRVFS